MISKRWIYGGAAVVALVAVSAWTIKARAADLGGNCCADLEERIAELEATTARKGNRKMSLTISGQVSKAILWHDIDGLAGTDKLRVIDNGNSQSRIRVDGEARVSPNMRAGFLVEMGFDETRGVGLGLAADDIIIRHSAVWLETMAGRVTIGRTSSATDMIVEIDTSNANIASLPMSLEPIWTYSGLGTIASGILNPTAMDGPRANIIRYDSPALAGFVASASWGGGQSASGDDLYDMALRYTGEIGGFKIAAGAGYRVERFAGFSSSDMRTTAGSASVMHALTGLFVTAAAGVQMDNPVFGDIQHWQVRGGVERRFFSFGATTLFGEYGDHKLKDFDIQSKFWGVGMVQSVDALAADLFVSFKSYDINGSFDANVGMAGLRVRF